MRFLRAIARVLIGLVFIFSGFAKLIDPVGSELIITEYLKAFGVEFMQPAALYIGTLLAGVETITGICVLLGLRMRIACTSALGLMILFTPITLYLAIFNPIADCGCFGEVVKLTNWQTLFKNVILIFFATLLFFQRKRYIPIASVWVERSLVSLYTVIIVAISLYSYRYLPMMDFLEYKIGVNIKDRLSERTDVSKPIYETVLIYSKDGKEQQFSIDSLPDSSWVFVDSRTKAISTRPAVFDLAISDTIGQYVTDSLLLTDRPLFLITIPKIEELSDSDYERMSRIYNRVEKEGVPCYLVTGSAPDIADSVRGRYGIHDRFFYADYKVLISLNRSNLGVVYINENTITGKWSKYNFPHNSINRVIEEDPEFYAAKMILNHRMNTLWTLVGIILFIAIIRYIFRFAYSKGYVKSKPFVESGGTKIREDLEEKRSEENGD